MKLPSRAKPTTDISSIISFALGQLSPEESLKVQDQIEKDPEASKTLEMVLMIMEHMRPSAPPQSLN